MGYLDLSKPHGPAWLSVLRSLQELRKPAYVEIHSRTKLITRLLQPTLQPVGGIHPLDSGSDLRIELMNSHARHVLRRKHPRFKAVLQMLRNAHKKETLLWVTETLETHEIIDVRPAPRTNRD